MATTQRTITIVLPDDDDIRQTLDGFREVKRLLSSACFNEGKPLKALDLHRAMYREVRDKTHFHAQLTCTAIRLVAAAYQTAQSNKVPPTRPFAFHGRHALYLVGPKARNAEFTEDGLLYLWTVNGRKRITYSVPAAFQPVFREAIEVDSINIVERNGRLLGRVTLTLAVPEPSGCRPVGIDLNETNAMVAADSRGHVLFLSGRATYTANRRDYKTRKRVQRKLDERKKQHQDTRSVRRLLQRTRHRQQNRTRTFVGTATKRLATWAPPQSVFVLEALQVSVPRKTGRITSKAGRRRVSNWPRLRIRQGIERWAGRRGIPVRWVSPAFTSQTCSLCGERGLRERHDFTCPVCGHHAHADINAAFNIRNRYTPAG